MSLRESFDSLSKLRGGIRCSTCVALAGMPDDDRETLEVLLGDRSVSVMMIVRACQSAGYESLTEGTLKRHRRGECAGLP